MGFDERNPTTSDNSHFLTHENFSFEQLKLQTSLPIKCDVSRIRSTLPPITNLQERIMSVAGIASNVPFQSVNQAFFFQRRLDVVELGQAIRSGDLTKAQHVYDALTALGQNTNGYKPFKNSTLENDFLAVGQALKTGDAVAAQQAYEAAPGQSSRLTLTTLQARTPRTRPTRKSFLTSAAPRQRSPLTLRMVVETGTLWRKLSSI